uniref:Uncharacterized protein n=1 Tax=Spongospora subterranea TaxID=70186 RepID=A0A0H5QJE6_9EUKA|eukprot:CRZ02235.1 hypothetical protein [Spongospora subterranea]
MFSFFQQGPRKSLERDANTAPTQDSSKREMMANLSKRTSVEGRDANTREKDTKESKLTNDPTNQPASSNKSSGKTKKEKVTFVKQWGGLDVLTRFYRSHSRTNSFASSGKPSASSWRLTLSWPPPSWSRS